MDKEKRTYSTGSVSDLGNGKWLLRVSAGAGVGGKRLRPSKTVPAKSRRDAERQLKKFIAEVDGMGNKEKMTIGQLIEMFTSEKVTTLSQPTQEWYEAKFLRIRGALGNMQLRALKPKDIDSFYAALSNANAKPFCVNPQSKQPYKNGLSGESVLHHHRALSACLNWAYTNDYIDCKVIDRVTPPKSDTREKRALSNGEVEAFLGTLQEQPLRWRAYLTLALHTGMRREELCALQWHNMDMNSCTINIIEAMQETQNGNTLDVTKNKSSNRVIQVSNAMTELLRQWRKEQLKIRMEYFEPWENNFVFTTETGAAISLARCSNKAKELMVRSGIVDASLHTLRHTCVTRLLAAGIPANDVAAFVGHASTKMTLDRYGHAADDYMQKCAEAMQRVCEIGQ